MRRGMFWAAVVLATVRSAGAQQIIDRDTTLDYLISPFEPTVQIVDGMEGPTTVEIVDGANIAPSIHVRNHSQLNVHGGITGGFLVAHDQARVNIYNGWIATGEDIVAQDDSVINIYGGRFGESLYAVGASVVNLYGGSFEKNGDGATLIADEQGTINVFGTGFQLGPPGNAFRSLTGQLSDGTPIDVFVFNYSVTPGPAQVVIHTIPEPTTAVLGMIVCACLFLDRLTPHSSRNRKDCPMTARIAKTKPQPQRAYGEDFLREAVQLSLDGHSAPSTSVAWSISLMKSIPQ